MALWDLRDLSTPPYAWGDFQDNIGLVKDGQNRITALRNKGTAGGRFLPMDNGNIDRAPTLATVDGRQMAVYDPNVSKGLLLFGKHADVPTTVVVAWKSGPVRKVYEIVADFSEANGERVVLYGSQADYAAGVASIFPARRTIPGSEALNQMNVLIFEMNGPSSRYYFNGQEISYDAAQRFASSGLIMGGDQADPNVRFSGAYGELAAIQGIFTGDEWERLTQATMWKWGKEASIPAGAKYKAAAPTRPLRRVRMDETTRNFYSIITNNGLTVEGWPGVNQENGALSTESRKSGLSYCELTITGSTGNGFYFGIAAPDFDPTVNGNNPGDNATDRRGVSVKSGDRYAWVDGGRPDTAIHPDGYLNGNDPALLRAESYVYPITWGILFDHDRGRFYFRNDAGWYNGHDPANPNGGLRTTVREACLYLAGSLETTVATVNFGQLPSVLGGLPTGASWWQTEPVPDTAKFEIVAEYYSRPNNYTPTPYTTGGLFPAGPSLVCVTDHDARGTYTLEVAGATTTMRLAPSLNGAHLYWLVDCPTEGVRNLTLRTTNGAYYNWLDVSIVKPTGLDVSTVAGVMEEPFRYSDGYHQNTLPIYVPPNGLALGMAYSGGVSDPSDPTRAIRWTDNSYVLPTSSDPTRSTVLASMRETTRTNMRVPPYSGDRMSAISFAPIQPTVITTGTLNVTEADDFVVSQSINKITASALAQEVDDSVSSQGFLKVVATTSLVEAGDTLSSTSKVILRATASIQESGDFMSSQTVNRVTGRANVSLDADTVSSTAIVQVKAATTVIEDSDTVSSNSIARVSATLSVTENDDTLLAASQSYLRALVNTSDGEDTLTSNVVAIIKATTLLSTDDDSINSTARVFVSGVGNMTESDDTLIAVSGTGSLALYADMFEQSDQVSSDARVILSGSGSTTDGNDTTTALVQVVINAQGAVTEASDSLVSTAIARASANASLAEDNDAVSASAKVAVRAYTVITEDSDIVTSTYFQSVFYASGSLIEEDDCLDSTARVLATIQSNLLDDDDSLNSLVRLRLNATTITQEENDLMVSQTVTRIAANSTMIEADDSVTAKLSVFYPIVTPDTRLVVVALPASRRATIPVGESRHAVVVAASRNAIIPALASRHAVL